jgi:hypothetical protein
MFKRFTIGEPDGSISDRILALRDALVSAGFDAPIRETIRWSIWLKLWGNVCFNPISALTLATLDRVTSEPGLRALRKSMMAEAQAVTTSLGLSIPEEMMERRLNAAGSVVGHKISMLQDLERGRSLEIDALVTACGVAFYNISTETKTRLIDIGAPRAGCSIARRCSVMTGGGHAGILRRRLRIEPDWTSSSTRKTILHAPCCRSGLATPDIGYVSEGPVMRNSIVRRTL